MRTAPRTMAIRENVVSPTCLERTYIIVESTQPKPPPESSALVITGLNNGRPNDKARVSGRESKIPVAFNPFHHSSQWRSNEERTTMGTRLFIRSAR